jgi:hypothetical protein
MRNGLNEGLAPPRRAALHCITPVGVGSAFAESMESYVIRLAASHRVARHRVEHFVGASEGEIPIYVDRSLQPPRLDGPTPEAAEFSRRLAELTGEPRVRRLGLGWLCGRVSRIQTLRSHRAWCPDCFGEARAEGSPAYLQLAWSLVNYERCLKHRSPLLQACPHCHRRSLATRRWNAHKLDHCSCCGYDLAPASVALASTPPVAGALKRFEKLEFDTARLLGELIARTTEIHSNGALPDVRRALDSAIARGRVKTAAELAQRCALAKSTVHAFLKPSSYRPSLDALSRIALVTDVSLVGLIDSQQWHVDLLNSSSVPDLAGAFRERSYNRQNWESVCTDLRHRLSAGGAMGSMAELARAYRVDASHLGAHLGELKHKIVARVQQHSQEHFEEAVHATAERIAEASMALWRAGKKPSARRVAQMLEVHRQGDIFKVAWRRVLRSPRLAQCLTRQDSHPLQMPLGL